MSFCAAGCQLYIDKNSTRFGCKQGTCDASRDGAIQPEDKCMALYRLDLNESPYNQVPNHKIRNESPSFSLLLPKSLTDLPEWSYRVYPAVQGSNSHK